jgi:hypothetical protein
LRAILLLAAALLGAALFASPAAATGTPPVADGRAGYIATGRDFRYAQATITVPAERSTAASPLAYAGLEGNGAAAVAGIAPCGTHALPAPHCTAGGWTGFYGTAITTLRRGHVHFLPLHPVRAGMPVAVSVYLNVAGGALHFTFAPAGEQPAYLASAAPGGPVYTSAVAADDWAGGPASRPAVAALNRFTGGAFTTLSGDRGTFGGPWTLTATLAPAYSPGPLTDGGTAFTVGRVS